MEIGVGLDASLNLSLGQQAELSKEAARLGYTSIWTPEGTGQDSFQLCAQRWAAVEKLLPRAWLRASPFRRSCTAPQSRSP